MDDASRESQATGVLEAAVEDGRRHLRGLDHGEYAELRQLERQLSRGKLSSESDGRRQELRHARARAVRDEIEGIRPHVAEIRILLRRMNPRLAPIDTPTKTALPVAPGLLSEALGERLAPQVRVGDNGLECVPIPWIEASSTLPGTPTLQDVHYGVLGYNGPVANLSDTVTGASGRERATWSVGLLWSVPVDQPGLYLVSNIKPEPPLMVSGRHRVIASGWAASDFDASARIAIGTFAAMMSPGNRVTSLHSMTLFDETRSDDREKYFFHWVQFPAEIIVRVQEPGDLWVGVYADVELFADDDDADSLAHVAFESFGIPANTTHDGDIWRLCP